MNAFLVALPSGKRIDIVKTEIFIGRNAENDVVHTDERVSRRHCSIVKKVVSYYITDLESTNGTYVNGDRITGEAKLKNNDTVSLGQKAAAYQFRLIAVDIKRAAAILKTPKVLLPAAIGTFVILSIPVYFLFFMNVGRIDIQKGITRLEEVYGEDVVPTDPAFIQELEKTVTLILRDPGFAPTLKKRLMYKDSIERIFADNRLQTDFSFIPWVESGYDPLVRNAGSQAAGMWQFIPDTARHYGLRVDRAVDERLDPIKSSKAAALCLKDLVAVLGNNSFLLVLAAYNAGDNAILYGLKQIEDPVRDRNYWYLSKHNLIPEETKRYVMLILGLIVIARAG